MDEMFAIKCQNCGGPMYSHQAKRSFECAYCETVIPWQADAGEPKSALGIRHTPLTVVDGLLKLTHVSQLERPEDPDWYFFNSYWRNQSVLEHLMWEDRGTAQEFQEATHVSIPCPFCGASFEGSSTQRVFECPSCGNKIGMADLLKRRPGSGPWAGVPNTIPTRASPVRYRRSRHVPTRFSWCASTPTPLPGTTWKTRFKMT